MDAYEKIRYRQEGRTAYFEWLKQYEKWIEEVGEETIDNIHLKPAAPKNPYEKGMEKHWFWDEGYFDASFDQ